MMNKNKILIGAVVALIIGQVILAIMLHDFIVILNML